MRIIKTKKLARILTPKTVQPNLKGVLYHLSNSTYQLPPLQGVAFSVPRLPLGYPGWEEGQFSQAVLKKDQIKII